jgi:hypothetical protein
VTIENAVGGRGGDELIGNWAANTPDRKRRQRRSLGRRRQRCAEGRRRRDFFAFDTKPNSSTNRDMIADFSVAMDTIWLDNKAFSKLGKGSYGSPVKFKKDMFVKASKAQDREDRSSTTAGRACCSTMGRHRLQIQAVEIATLKKGLAMTYNDFFVI